MQNYDKILHLGIYKYDTKAITGFLKMHLFGKLVCVRMFVRPVGC